MGRQPNRVSHFYLQNHAHSKTPLKTIKNSLFLIKFGPVFRGILIRTYIVN
jgi:hypothetical protein